MLDNGLIYVIPPYILHTCVGQELQRELTLVDPGLAEFNFFPPNSAKYRFRTPADVDQIPDVISADPKLNELIVSKLKERFTAWGVLGRVPYDNFNHQYIYKMYQAFRKRLEQEPRNTTDNSSSAIDHDSASDDGKLAGEKNGTESASPSIYSEKKVGEFFYEPRYGSSWLELASLSLKELLALASLTREQKFSFFPYLMINEKQSFLSPLPMYWTSMSVEDRQDLLEKELNLSIGLDNGYSTINMKVQSLQMVARPKFSLTRKYFNFIADKEVRARTGIYYYEIGVEQRATKASRYTTIIHTHDESVSSGSCILFSAGFTKRFTKFCTSENQHPATFSSLVDLRETQREILKYNHESLDTTLEPGLVNFLSGEPGVLMDGSVAVSFNNSCSFAPNRDQRDLSASGGWGRRMSHSAHHLSREPEISDLGIDIPFSTTCKVSPNSDKFYTSDVVGVGVNFITNSLFITVNGVIVKVIQDEDMKAGTSFKDSIFSHGSNPGSLYPIIGFQLSHMPFLEALGDDTSETCIRTNFGHRSFKFDIDNYVQSFKAAQSEELQKTISETVESSSLSDAGLSQSDLSIFDSKSEHLFLQNTIREYLQVHGYLKALNAYEDDLLDMDRHVFKSCNGNIAQKKSSFPTPPMKHRHVVKKFLEEGRYPQVAEYLKSTYPQLPSLKKILFELSLLEYLKVLLEAVDKEGPDGTGSSEKYSLLHQGRLLYQDPEATLSVRKSLSLLFSELFDTSDAASVGSDAATRLKILKSRKDDAKMLAHYIGDRILEFEHMEKEKESELERMVNTTRNNIIQLSELDHGIYKLINFDKEYLS